MERFKKKGNDQVITLLALGLDNAGKTTIIQAVKGEPSLEVAPTMGFESFELKTKKFDVKIYDLGGGARIRGIWQNYLAEAHGIIYVIDSADIEKLEECRVIFDETLSDDRVRGKSILILANKQDKPEAVDELDLCMRMKFDEVVNRNECHSKVVLCSALPSHGRKKPKMSKLDRGIMNGYLWLLDMIERDFDSLQERIDNEVGEQKKQEAKERAERIERVRKRREERERQEKALDDEGVTDDRPQPEGISYQDLPNESPQDSRDAPKSITAGAGAELSNDKYQSVQRHNADNSYMSLDNESIKVRTGHSENGNAESPAVEVTHNIAAESALPGAIAASSNEHIPSTSEKQNEEVSEHPRALSAASLKELVRDTPTTTKLHGTDSTLSALPTELNPNVAKHDSVVSLQNKDDESCSVSSSTTTEKKRKKKRKHKKRNKIEPGHSDESESLQGKLAPIRNAPDSNPGYGKLPPIGGTPNFSSDVEL